MRNILVQSTVVLFALAVLAPSRGRSAVAPGEIERWQGDLSAIHQALNGGDWEAAGSAAEELLDEVLAANPSTRLNELVSVALLSQALAEVGSGDTEDGLWHWNAAQNLNPRLRRARFPDYGEPGAFLENHRLRGPGEPPPGLAPVALAPGQTPPGLGPDHEVPEEWARFELVVDGDGSVRAPVLLAPGRPTAVLEALEALRELELEPAEAEGEAVAVYWRPRPELWVVKRSWGPADGASAPAGAGGTLDEALASCEELGGVMESSDAWVGPESPFLGPEPGLVETLRSKALRQGADTLIVDSHDKLTVKGRIFRCGEGWYPPHLEP